MRGRPAQIPLELHEGGRTLRVETRLVGPGGATVISSERISVGTRFEAVNLRTDRRGWCRVTWHWPDEASNGFRLGLELLEPEADFWGTGSETPSA